LIKHTGEGIVDVCLLNNAVASDEALEKYRQENAFPVEPDIERVKECGCKVIAEDLLGIDDYVRHDSKKLTKVLINLMERYRVIKR
jgi:2-phospho-L-lactate transferase/gluconeogenesis factor (CofD/UPF0052 family)